MPDHKKRYFDFNRGKTHIFHGWYPAETNFGAMYADDQMPLGNNPAQAESLLYSQIRQQKTSVSLRMVRWNGVYVF